MSTAREQVNSLIHTASNAVEEAISWMSEDLTIGDDGIIEAIVKVENQLGLIKAKLVKQENPPPVIWRQ